MRPYMRDDEINAINRLLDEMGPDLSVLEWGSGGSTIAFACHPNVRSWLSVESDEGWYVRVRRLLDQGKNHAVREKISLRRATTESGYLAEPYGGEYDLIFVDGKWRNECLMVAPTYLAQDGLVLIHDCDRAQYQPAMAEYPEQRRLSKGNDKHQGLMLLWYPLPAEEEDVIDEDDESEELIIDDEQ